MAELGELSLWAALPIAVLAMVASIAAGWTRRGDLGALGGRAAEAAAALLLVALLGLGYALATVQLRYAYVASLSGFQVPVAWRLAALSSGPAGGALTLTFLIMVAAALSYRVGGSRQALARSGCLATLATVGLIMVVVRARPFGQLHAAAMAGMGLPMPMRSLDWQVEVWASLLATACAAFAFAGVIGEQLVEAPALQRLERVAARWVAGLTTLAVLVATWRAYSASGWLLDTDGAYSVIMHGSTWLVAMAYLHAPGGAAVPVWASRWKRILGVTLFPAALGSSASVLSAGGALPATELWAAGLAVGIVSGAMAGMTRSRFGLADLDGVPGFGLSALAGGLLALIVAAFAAVWALLGDESSAVRDWTFTFFALVALVALVGWSVSRPAGRFKLVWPLAVIAGITVSLIVLILNGPGAPGFAGLSGLTAALLVGALADVTRLNSVRRRQVGAEPGGDQRRRAIVGMRARRRGASLLAHLGLAFAVLGFSAAALTRSDTRLLNPGDTLSVSGWGDEVRVTYLGLSRYQVGELDKRVASFKLARGDGDARLVTAELIHDRVWRRDWLIPFVKPGVVRDVVVAIGGRRGDEAVMCRLSTRPLASMVWLGGGLLLISMFWAGASGESGLARSTEAER